MQTTLPRRHFKALLTPRYLSAAMLLLLGIVGSLGLLAAIKQKNSLMRMLVEQSAALVETLEASSRNALVANRLLEKAIAQRLLDNARLIDRILATQTLHPRRLSGLVRLNQLDRLELRNGQGELIAAFPPAMGMPWPQGPMPRGPEMPHRHMEMMHQRGGMPGPPAEMMSRHFYHPILEGQATEALQGFGARKFWLGTKYGVAVKRQHGSGLIVITAAADSILRFREQIGLQRLLTDLQSSHFAYLSIQDAEGTIIAHSDARLLGTTAHDAALAAAGGASSQEARIRTAADGHKVLETIRSFAFEGEPLGLLRVGMSLRHVDQVWRQALLTLLLSSGAMLVVGAIGVGIILTNQAAHFRRVHELERAVTRQERLAALGHLAAEVAHEVRNPLNAISMGLQRIAREFRPREATAHQEFTDITTVIQDEVRRLNQTIENFLKLARPVKLQPHAMQIDDLLKEIETLMQAEARNRGVHWQVAVAPRLPPLLADRGQLRQALLNLILNALQATPAGGRVALEVESAADRLRLRLHDTGTGIVPRVLERIFDPYFTTKEDGTGLGLAIVQQIVEAHGGHLEVASTPGQGSTFTMWLPFTHGEEA